MRIPSGSTYTDSTKTDDRPGFYYVSLIDGDKFALLAGPYMSHGEALKMVNTAKDAAYSVNSAQCAFACFGTCRLETNAGAGILNKYGKL